MPDNHPTAIVHLKSSIFLLKSTILKCGDELAEVKRDETEGCSDFLFWGEKEQAAGELNS